MTGKSSTKSFAVSPNAGICILLGFVVVQTLTGGATFIASLLQLVGRRCCVAVVDLTLRQKLIV